MSLLEKLSTLQRQSLEYEACREGTAELRAYVLKLLEGEKPGFLLDVGAGNGEFCKAAKEKLGMKVVATELRRSYVTCEGFDVAEVDLDAEPLPFSDDTFDYVVNIEVVEHLRNPWGCIREMVRVAAPGGLIVITTPNIEGMITRLKFLCTGILRSFESPVWTNPLEHFHPFTAVEFARGFDLVGLVPPQISYAKPLCRPLGWRWYWEKYRNRSKFRNLAGWVKWNLLWLPGAALSFLRYGSSNTNNRLFAESIVVVCRKHRKRVV